jgi:WD40 repeat protein
MGLATVNTTDTLRLWPLSKPHPIYESRLLSEGKNGIIAFSPNGNWLAAGKRGETAVYLFVVDDPTALSAKLVGIEQGVGAVSFSLDGQFLVVGGDDGVVRRWTMVDVARGILEKGAQSGPTPVPRPGSTSAPQISSISLDIIPLPLKAHDDPIRALAFELQNIEDKQDSLLATAGADHAIRLWSNSNPPALQDELYGHEAEVTTIFFGSNPRLLLSAGQDGTVRFWNLDELRAPQNLTELEAELETWMAKACRRAGRDFSATEKVFYLGDSEVPSTCAEYLVKPGS